GLDGGRTLTPPILLGEVLMRNTCSILALGAVLAFPPTALAQDSSELLTRMRAMEDRIKALEAEVQALKGSPAAAQTASVRPATATPVVAQAPPASAPEAQLAQAPTTL